MGDFYCFESKAAVHNSLRFGHLEKHLPRKAVVDLASLYAVCWQSLERTERAMDSERLLAISQLLCRLGGW